jgi:uncharacterized protein (DUF362 family)/NAD-dependent dihydropyrimidine dehydrogenase PreA subunit
MTRVLILDAAYDETMDRAVAKVLAEFPMDWQGKNVLVKPNILAPHPPEAGVTTHPGMVSAVVRQLMEKGARVTVGDNPGMGGYGRAEKTARTCGLMDASLGCYVNIGKNPVRHNLVSKFTDHVTISGEVLEADIVVNLPKLKTHGLTYITGAIKNTFGYVVGGEKMRMHSSAVTARKFAALLLDIYRIRPPDLSIMDAVVAMEGNGPSNGTLRTIGKVLASDNAVSLDAVAVALIGQKLKAIPLVDMAGKQGLGETDLSRLELNAPVEAVRDFKLPSTFVPGITGILLNRILSRRISCAPEILHEKCKACGVCIQHCPVQAMRMCGDFPEPDLDLCIRCYCCQEMCPQDAIVLSGRVIRFLRRAMH